MKKLEKCLPNVYVTKKQFDFQNNGKFISIGHFECMKLLLTKKWKYLFLLQMDDISIKSNHEILQILETMDFPLDIHINDNDEQINNKFDNNLSWSYKDLDIFLKGIY